MVKSVLEIEERHKVVLCKLLCEVEMEIEVLSRVVAHPFMTCVYSVHILHERL